jgi:hypothetical protein
MVIQKESRPTPDDISAQQLDYPASQADMTPQQEN